MSRQNIFVNNKRMNISQIHLERNIMKYSGMPMLYYFTLLLTASDLFQNKIDHIFKNTHTHIYIFYQNTK
jgi:hypothetical protein